MLKQTFISLILILVSSFSYADQPEYPNEDLTMTLEDGRTLGYAIYGSDTGTPLIYFYGAGGSRYMGRRLDSLATVQEIRLIVPDRPGIGQSSYVKKRKLTDWPADVAALADHLEIRKFSVMSESGGTPYAIACAWGLPNRINQAIVVSGVSPTTGDFDPDQLPKSLRRNLKLAQRAPLWFLRFNYRQIDKLISNNPDKFIELASEQSSEPDKMVMSSKSELAVMIAAFKEAFRQGYAGVALETRLYARDWGIPLEEIDVPVLIYHGDLDQNTPLVMAEYLASKIPESVLTVFPGEGHATIMLNNGRQIFSVVQQSSFWVRHRHKTVIIVTN